MRRGLKLQDLLAFAKRSFVRAALEELESRGETVSTSRLSVMTGITRKELSSMMSSVQNTTPPSDPLFTKVIGRWRDSERYRGADNILRPLAYEGVGSEFGELVSEVSTDLNPYTILFELERLGAVTKKDGHAYLNWEVFNPRGDLGASLELVASDVADLLGAVEENVYANPEIPNLHIKTYYDNISVESLPQIREWLLRQGSQFHSRMRAYLSKLDKDTNPQLYSKAGGARVAVGTFSIVQDASQPERRKS